MMSDVTDRLAEEGLTLPPSPSALGDYLPAVRAGDLVFTAGQLPLVEGVLVAEGLVDCEVDLATAHECARRCALNALAAASSVCDLDTVVRVVKVSGFVASGPGFTGQAAVMNGASAIMTAAFGDVGRHAREAVGVTTLPLGAPVEVSIVLQLGV